HGHRRERSGGRRRHHLHDRHRRGDQHRPGLQHPQRRRRSRHQHRQRHGGHHRRPHAGTGHYRSRRNGHFYGSPREPADRERHRPDQQRQQRGGDGLHGKPDVHRRKLEYAADHYRDRRG